MHAHPAGIDPQYLIAETADGRQVMGHEDDSHAGLLEFAQLRKTLLAKGHVANCQHFIDHQDFRINVHGDRKAQPHVHAGRIVLDRLINKTLEFSKGNYVIKSQSHLLSGQAEEGPVEEDILTPGQIGVKSCPKFQEGRDSPPCTSLCRSSVRAHGREV